MRRLTEPQAHRGRAAVIGGRYPEGMEARCALCAKSQPIEQGKLVRGRARPDDAARYFLCSDCMKLLPAGDPHGSAETGVASPSATATSIGDRQQEEGEAA